MHFRRIGPRLLAVLALASTLAASPVARVLGERSAEGTVLAEARPAPTAPPPAPGSAPEVRADRVRLAADRILRHAAASARPPTRTPARAARPQGHLIVRVTRPVEVRSRAGAGRVLGRLATGSKYYGAPISAWVIQRSPDGRFGRVTLPWSGTATGWIRLKGLPRAFTPYSVRASLSRHRITVLRHGEAVMTFPAATGAPVSPTPPGRYFVTDRVAFPSGHSLGTFAFGISGIQPKLPPGWRGGNQLAIHGTNSPGTIGRSVSAGCLRVSEEALARLKPLLQPGTPVVIEP